MATVISEAFLEELAYTCHQDYKEKNYNLRQVLSKVDLFSYRALEKAYYPRRTRWMSEKHRLRVAKAFSSPFYSDAAKKYFATVKILESKFILLSAGKFLTERIIFSAISKWQGGGFSMSYLAALMGSGHLSERIVFESIRMVKPYEGRELLPLIPDPMITPEVMNLWLSNDDGVTDNFRGFAAQRIKQAYPEYAEFPDEWALKVFCGG